MTELIVKIIIALIPSNLSPEIFCTGILKDKKPEAILSTDIRKLQELGDKYSDRLENGMTHFTSMPTSGFFEETGVWWSEHCVKGVIREYGKFLEKDSIEVMLILEQEKIEILQQEGLLNDSWEEDGLTYFKVSMRHPKPDKIQRRNLYVQPVVNA